MSRKISRLFVALAAVSVAGATALGSSAASATSPRLAGHRAAVVPAVRHFSAAGSYEATVPDAHMSSHLVITAGATTPNAGTFAFTDVGDYGDWVFQGRTIAMQIASSVSGHEGIVLIGRVTHEGITGWLGVPSYGQITWSATRDAASSAARARVARSAARLAAEQPPGNAAGTYTAVFPTVPLSDTLTLTHDRLSTRSGSLVFVDLQDTGNWVQMGKHIALGVSTGQDAGVTMIATRTATGLDSAESPGIYVQPSSGVYPWYGTKTS